MPRHHEVDPEFLKMLAGYGLATAEIVYRMPDHRHILQIYIWQEYDLHPQFPELRRFLGFWHRKLDGPLYEVRVAHELLVKPREFKIVGHHLILH